ncbi:hypothetical protein LOK49_LG03G00811, partial [Camellia lanceoleosa]
SLSPSPLLTYLTAILLKLRIKKRAWVKALTCGCSCLQPIIMAFLSCSCTFWTIDFTSNVENSITAKDLASFCHGHLWFRLEELGMKCLFYLLPSLNGIVHHSLSAIAVAYAMFTGEGQLYTFMVLISEITTPKINMRWYLDTAGLKRSSAYLINGVVIFFAWLVARILLFAYMFCHVYLHYDQVILPPDLLVY